MTTASTCTVRGTSSQGNEIDNNAASGVSFYNGGIDMGSGNVISRNSIHHNNLGIFAWDANGITVVNNVIYGHQSTGVSVNRAAGAKIYNNTISGNIGYGVDISNSTAVVLQNDIIYNNNNGTNVNDVGSGTIKDHNVCNSGCAINANPMFVSSTSFALQPGSPAIDSGVSLGSAVTTDMAGKGRPSGSGYDIGAYEVRRHVGVVPAAATADQLTSRSSVTSRVPGGAMFGG